MKKFFSLLLALSMVFALVACGGTSTAGNPADAIDDEMTSEDGKYEIAFVLSLTSPSQRLFSPNPRPPLAPRVRDWCI